MEMKTYRRILVEKNVPCRMRDGITLYSDVYRPDEEGRFPVLLHRTPYDKEGVAPPIGVHLSPLRAARRGYAVIVQDVRGRFSSEGKFNVFFNEAQDGYDSVQWAASLPYSNGKVGMWGSSYTGVTQLAAAISKPRQLLAISPELTGSNLFDGWTYQGAAFTLAFNILWTIGLASDELARLNLSQEERTAVSDDLAASYDDLERTCSPPAPAAIETFSKHQVARYFYDWTEHPAYDEFWKEIDHERHYEELDVAALHVGGWYDIFLKGTLRNYLGLSRGKRSRNQKLVIGPWFHELYLSNVIGNWNAGFLSQGAAVGLESTEFRWFDHWLKGDENGIMEEPPVLLYVMGANKWRTENDWPLPRTKYTRFHFHSRGNANTLSGDGTLSIEPPLHEPPDAYVYSPENPVPTLGGAIVPSGHPGLSPGVFDQRALEKREDVLVYTTDALDRAIEVTGPVHIRLWASSSAVDTDFTGKLVDVHPDGYARNLCDGIARARFRESLETPSLLEPGRTYEFDIDLVATSNLFRQGHKIRVEISSSNFPRFDRNTNTGHWESSWEAARRAQQTVHHEAETPSHIILPIVLGS